ncbi:unnamed protein product [Cercospora beticola]|nr:unnamed protein product [Cercospora beticola]
MSVDGIDKGPGAYEIYEKLNASKKEIRICHIENELDEEGRVRCRLEVAALETIGSPENLNGELAPIFDLPPGVQGTDIRCQDVQAMLGLVEESLNLDSGASAAAQPNKPVYKAISWAWGDSSKKAQIVLNNQVVEVSQNAQTLLRRFCFEQQHSPIWLDAICINQADMAERSEQVAIMHHVYKNATQVLVWLGEEDVSIAEAALSSIDKLVVQCMEVAGADDTSLDKFFMSGTNARYAERPLPDYDWSALEKLFNNPWFYRLWVVQEVMLGNEPLCYLGMCSRPQSDISLAARWLHYRNFSVVKYIGTGGRGLTLVAKTWNISRRMLLLQDLLQLSSQLECTEPLDKVYGMLGIMQQEASSTLWQSQRWQSLMTADYSADLATVYAKFTKAAITSHPVRSHALTILESAQCMVPITADQHDDHQDWPSWVPRFYWRDSLADGSPQLLNCRGHAAGDISWSVEMIDKQDPLIITIPGILIDSVSVCSVPFTYDVWEDDSVRYQWLAAMSQYASKLGYTSHEIALTLTCEQRAGTGDPASSPSHTAQYEEYMNCGEGIAFKDLAIGPHNYVLEVYIGILNRRFFTTQKGIGIGPPGMRANDWLCMLFGGRTLYVLRPQENHFVLIGTGYLYGVMQGQYANFLREENTLVEQTHMFEIH